MGSEGLEKRVERLEAEVSDIKDTLSDVKASQARAQVILEGIADSVERLVDGRGTIRCAEHTLGLQGLKTDLERHCKEAAHTIGHIQGELVAQVKEVRAAHERDTSKMALRIESLEKSRDAMKNKLLGFGLACSLIGGAIVAIAKALMG